jgi:hypothetical protein
VRAPTQAQVPFRGETVSSYLSRLAYANHLDLKQLQRYLTDTPPFGYPRPDWLATASNRPLAVLQDRLSGLREQDRDPARQRRHARPACRLCMALAIERRTA